MNKKGGFLDSLTARQYAGVNVTGAAIRLIVPVASKE